MEIVNLLEKRVDRKYLEPFLEGHLAVPEDQPIDNPYLVQENGLVYLKKTYKQETKILEEMKRLMGLKLDPYEVDSDPLPLSEDQKRAVKRPLPLMLLTGGPGTGKTYTAGYMIRLLMQKRPHPFVLAAPTGKACAQLKRSIEESCKDIELPPFRVLTLHALLEPNKERALPLIPEELVVVDEASMIDLDMMGLLLSKIRGRLILLGDPNQLPPVETPSLFPDMVEVGDRFGFHVGLKECLRVEDRKMIDCGRDLLEGRLTFDLRPLEEFKMRECEVLLTPLRRGPYGVESLNSALFERELQKEKVRVPIIITKNDFQLNLFNGETGVIEFRRKDWNGSIRATKGVVSFGVPIYELPPFDLAYAISVHKSQGSAYDHPILLLPEGSSHFGREMLYTAFTRAKKGITVYGDRGELEALVAKSSRRRSGLTLRI